MTLGFMKTFPWKVNGEKEQTYFREKILASRPTIYTPKLHTLREDKTNRWKAGRKIEMVYRGAGYSILDHFNKDIPYLEKCVSVQEVNIKYRNVQLNWMNYVEVDGRKLTTDEFEKFVRNDGFRDVLHFMRWFKGDFTGKIIHWTDLHY